MKANEGGKRRGNEIYVKLACERCKIDTFWNMSSPRHVTLQWLPAYTGVSPFYFLERERVTITENMLMTVIWWWKLRPRRKWFISPPFLCQCLFHVLPEKKEILWLLVYVTWKRSISLSPNLDRACHKWEHRNLFNSSSKCCFLLYSAATCSVMSLKLQSIREIAVV
jgi:hypothetical protein